MATPFVKDFDLQDAIDNFRFTDHYISLFKTLGFDDEQARLSFSCAFDATLNHSYRELKTFAELMHQEGDFVNLYRECLSDVEKFLETYH